MKAKRRHRVQLVRTNAHTVVFLALCGEWVGRKQTRFAGRPNCRRCERGAKAPRGDLELRTKRAIELALTTAPGPR